MAERAVSPHSSVLAEQARARAPRNSVWVAANAGSGKTHVLTERVLALLLNGAAPESLLCLTYTKAAAAEMRARVSARLGDWAVMEDGPLADALAQLSGEPITPERLDFARTLFARALETPGGLKINTIHAFAESLLQRFPLEAGVPLGFSVIEEAAQKDLVATARDEVLLDAFEGQGPQRAPMEVLFAQLSDHALDSAIAEGLSSMRKLFAVLADPAAAKARLDKALGGPLPSEAALLEEVVTNRLADANDCLALHALAPPKPEGKALTDRLARIDVQNPSAQDLFSCFLTAEGTALKRVAVKAVHTADPALVERLTREAARLEHLRALLAKTRQLARSEALIDVLGAIVARYERQKQALGLLDFDDLIARTVSLLTRSALGPWVRYKLDQGITHILVDESQDTNPEQWAVVDALAEEFFSGEGAVERPRSIFAVGDQKQSIYSFQGADPSLFPQAGRAYAQKARTAQKPFEEVRLRASFRSLEHILEAVDLTFRRPNLAEALLSVPEDIVHQSARADRGGMVALWPLEAKAEAPGLGPDWPLPDLGPDLEPDLGQDLGQDLSPNENEGAKETGGGEDEGHLDGPHDVDEDQSTEMLSNTPAAHRLAARIAQTIGQWLDEGRQLPARGRAIRPDDILVLVQTRSPIFSHLVRALKQAGIPSPGADRLAVASHIAVLDLIALGEVALNPHDDLSLAALLRSPLFDLSESALFVLAHDRKNESLFSRLGQSPNDEARAAFARLHDWRQRLRTDRPYEFYAHILFAKGGLRRFHARLGQEVDDVLGEFMDLALVQEQADQPSLSGFLSQMRARDETIKRELSEGGAGVRVMTVHGAKGLEAPIVILADAASPPSTKQLITNLLFAQTPTGPYLVHRISGDDEESEAGALHPAWRSAQKAEYWRKLYVAMTRAEDELHLVGVAKDGEAPSESWYGTVRDALADRTGQTRFGLAGEVALYPADAAGSSFMPAKSPPASPLSALELPPVAAQEPVRPVHPSRLETDATPDAGLAPLAGQMGKPASTGPARPAEEARAEGVALHALLQHLPAIAPSARPAVARSALEVLLAHRPERHEAIAQRALELLDAPHLAFLFGPQARPEVPIIASGVDESGAFRLTGRIDRLVRDDQNAVIVDFKSDATPAEEAAHIAPAYLRQLGLYRLAIGRIWPDLEIKVGLVWTTNGTLTWIPPKMLDAAVSGVLLVEKGPGAA